MSPKKKPRQDKQLGQLGVKRKRTRNGCLTCRDRHLKCDENFPICNNCNKSKRECLRGIRLKFLNTNVYTVAPNFFNRKSIGELELMDQSIVTASNYQDGLKNYAKYMSGHTARDLKKAEVDFDKYSDVTLSMEEPASKRPRMKKTHDSRSNSINFKNLLDDFLKFDNDADMDNPIMAKFNYFEPPTGLQSYLQDIKVHTSKPKTRERSEESQTSNSVSDYYIFDSDEEQDNLTSTSTDFEDSFLEPISDSKEILLLSNYLGSCKWFLNGITDTNDSDYWLNSILSEKALKDKRNFLTLLESSGQVLYGLLGESLNFNVTEFERKLQNAATSNKVDELTNDPSFERDLKLYTLLLTGYFQKSCHDRIDITKLNHYLNLFNKVIVEKLLKNDIINNYVPPLFSIDVFTSILYDSEPLMNPFKIESLLVNKVTEFDALDVHLATKQKFESTFDYDDIDDYESDESDDDDYDAVNDTEAAAALDEDVSMTSVGHSRAKVKEAKLNDSSYLITLVNILGKLNFIIKNRKNAPANEVSTSWDLILKELTIFEKNCPFTFSPISIGPFKTQAAQGLVTMGISNNGPELEFAADPPFPIIKFANEMGLILHIIHHSIYLLSEKYKSENCESFFTATKEYFKFRAVLWYNETLPHEGSEPEKMVSQMARRLISFFLSCHKLQNHESENIWVFYGWCFQIAKQFLSAKDIKELEKRL